MAARSTLGQLWRYGAVGLLSNAVLFLAYLLLTAWGMPSKVAMTLLYAAGVLQTFIANRSWTFAAGRDRGQFTRYCLAYAFGYVFNLAGLTVLVDRLGYPHELVQGLLILSTAAMLFLLHKLWVFRSSMEAQGVP